MPAAIAIVVATAAAALSRSSIVGFYHDDGIYLSSARSIAGGQNYRLDHLPGEPPATKYPPLYPLTLAAFTGGLEPLGLPWLKVPSILALTVTAVLVWVWLRSDDVPETTAAVAALLVGLNPGLLSHADLLLSDVLFTAFSTSTVWLAARGRHPALLGLMLGATVLTRSVGVAFVVALVSALAARRRWRAAVICLTTCAATLVPYFLWRLEHHASVSPLLQYYVAYEPQVWRALWAEPSMVAAVITSNLRFFAAVFGEVAGLPIAGLQLLIAGAALVGLWWRRRTASGLTIGLSSLAYLVLIVGHPYPMARYLLPLMPLIWILAAHAMAPLGARGATVLILPLASCMLWMQHYRQLPADAVHGGFGRSMIYTATGFLETADWIRRCTLPSARLASAHDPFYYLATGRKAVRPWLHNPITYTPGYGHYRQIRNPTNAVQAELDNLTVEILIVDPLLKGGEGDYGRDSLTSLSESRNWLPIWTSSDGGHTLYCRARGSGCDRAVILSSPSSCQRQVATPSEASP